MPTYVYIHIYIHTYDVHTYSPSGLHAGICPLMLYRSQASCHRARGLRQPTLPEMWRRRRVLVAGTTVETASRYMGLVLKLP